MSQAPRLIDPITGSASNALNALSSLQQAAEANATQTNISEQQIAAGLARERMQQEGFDRQREHDSAERLLQRMHENKSREDMQEEERTQMERSYQIQKEIREAEMLRQETERNRRIQQVHNFRRRSDALEDSEYGQALEEANRVHAEAQGRSAGLMAMAEVLTGEGRSDAIMRSGEAIANKLSAGAEVYNAASGALDKALAEGVADYFNVERPDGLFALTFPENNLQELKSSLSTGSLDSAVRVGLVRGLNSVELGLSPEQERLAVDAVMALNEYKGESFIDRLRKSEQPVTAQEAAIMDASGPSTADRIRGQWKSAMDAGVPADVLSALTDTASAAYRQVSQQISKTLGPQNEMDPIFQNLSEYTKDVGYVSGTFGDTLAKDFGSSFLRDSKSVEAFVQEYRNTVMRGTQINPELIPSLESSMGMDLTPMQEQLALDIMGAGYSALDSEEKNLIGEVLTTNPELRQSLSEVYGVDPNDLDRATVMNLLEQATERQIETGRSVVSATRDINRLRGDIAEEEGLIVDGEGNILR